MKRVFTFLPILIFIVVGISAAAVASELSAPIRLTCEYLADPLGIDDSSPRLAWQVNDSRRGAVQSAYQILVSKDPERLAKNVGDVLDTGKVQSDRSIQIAYAGAPLQSGVRYYWAVRTWDADDRSSPFSEPAFWQMGLLDKSDWKGQWIGFGGTLPQPARRHNGYHSQIAADANQEKWAVIDLGETQKFDSVRLYPAHPFNYKDTPGFLYPVRFRIEVSGDPIFSAPKTVFDATAKDIDNPGDVPQTYAFEPVDARYVRLSVTKLANREENNYGFALAEMQVLAGAKNLAQGKVVTGLDTINDDSWSQDRLTDGVTQAVNPGQNWTPSPAPMLRKTFNLPAPVTRATLTATALGLYEISLNGQRIGKNLLAPEWTDYHTRIQYQTYDVTSDLREGENAVGAILGEGWYAGRVGLIGFRVYGDRLAFYAQLNIECEDGSRHTVVSDGSWKGTLAGPLRGNDIIHGEIWDARKEMPTWDQTNFDDSQWKTADELPAPQAVMVAQKNEPIQVAKKLAPIAVTEPKPYVYVYDLGQNMVGWCRVRIQGATGMSIRLQYAEVLNPDGTVYTDNLRGPYQIDELILNGSEVTFEPRFTYHGFRYLQISGLNKAIPAQDITGCVVYSAPLLASSFECSSPMINKLVKNILWTQRGNMHSTPTDCPQRDERLGWMGDAQIFSQAACFNMNMAAFYTKWIQDICDAQSDKGQFSNFSPNPKLAQGDFVGAPSWADAGIIVPWQVYVNYGDTRILERHYASMQRWIDYIQKNSKDYIWTDGRGHDYGDWLNGDTLILDHWPKKGADISREQLATAFSAYSTDLLSRIAQVLGKKEDAERYRQLFEAIRNAYYQKYYESDGKNTEDNQTAYALGLHFNLIPPDRREAAVKNLLRKIEDYNGHISTGIQATNRMMMELANEGRADVAYELLNNRTIPSWGYMIDHNATTVWERWDGWVEGRGFQNAGMNSFNHYAIGAVGEWIFRTIAGINPDPSKPGYTHFRIHPRPGGGVTFAKTFYDSIQGRINVEWKKEANSFTLDAAIPANTHATIVLPANSSDTVTESGRTLPDSPALKFVQLYGKELLVEAPAGCYQFRVDSNP